MEPKLLYCTQRDAGDEIHIECRMEDGQKGAFIHIDSEFPELASLVCGLLNRHDGGYA